VAYDGPNVSRIVGREICRQDGEDDPLFEYVSRSDYKCAICRNWGNGIEMDVEWAYPFG
jgi:hypothetical protein